MVKKIAGLLAVLLILLTAAGFCTELPWNIRTEGQAMLKAYIDQVNLALAEQGEAQVNSLFEQYEKLAVLGITERDDSPEPEGVEITVSLLPKTINQLQLRVNNTGRFPSIAAAFLRALNPEATTLKAAMEIPKAKADKAAKNPQTSFEDEVEELNGTQPRVYYAYYPNQYQDGVSWLQMTIIFPLEGTWDGISVSTAATVTKAPDTYSGNDANYDGYFSQDDYTHLEYFSTPTPEPDSAAAEEEKWVP